MALQEVISLSYEQLLAHPTVQRDWVVTDCNAVLATSPDLVLTPESATSCAVTDVEERTKSWYCTMLLVRKSWLVANRLDRLDASLVRYNSPMRRALLALEFGTVDGVSVRAA